jgi:hypothetical protein
MFLAWTFLLLHLIFSYLGLFCVTTVHLSPSLSIYEQKS